MRKLIILVMILSAGLCASAQSAFDKKVAEAVRRLSCAEPDEQMPVTLNAGLVVEKDSIAVIVKVRIAPGWHIYQYVPSTMPYIPIDPILKLDAGLQSVGNWGMSKPVSSATDPGVLIYENNAVLIHKVVRSKGTTGIIQTGLYYQTCNLRQCLPPVEKTIDLNLK